MRGQSTEDEQGSVVPPVNAPPVNAPQANAPPVNAPQANAPPVNAPQALASDTNIAGRYRVIDCLKRGPQGDTLLGLDQTTGHRVVIKTTHISRISDAVYLRIQHEAEVLRRFHDPTLACLLEIGATESQYYLVMPYVEGTDLKTRLEEGPLSVEETLAIGGKLMSALQAVHEVGILHRDIKPANLIVNSGRPIEWATLIDFGLAHSSQLDPSLRHELVGTARYMSPEQAGMLDCGVGEPSDLYSAGVVLFECLAGAPPFVANDVGELLRLHMTQTPASLRGLGWHVPRALDEVVQRLLRKDPRDRYQTADAVRCDLQVIREGLHAGVTEPTLVIGQNDRRQTLTEPAFVGRSQELEQLQQQLLRARRGKAGLILLEAESGVGKTRLLDELAQRGRQEGAWVLRGYGRDKVGQRPFQLMEGLASEIISACQLDGTLAEEFPRRLDSWRPAVCAALPQLRGTLLGDTTSETDGMLGPRAFGPLRSLQGLSALLEALGTPHRPALVLLDDCQWADDLAVDLLAQWQDRQRQRKSHRCQVLIVVAFRGEDIAKEHPLRAVKPTFSLKLKPFSQEELLKLANSMAGELPPAALRTVEEFSEGSPFMASAVLRGLVESGALVADEQGWRIEEDALSDLQSSRHAAAFLARRVSLLPKNLLRLLRVAAVLGKDFDVEMAAELSKQSASQARFALREARRRHVIWERPGGKWAFVHDRLRSTLLAELPAAQQRKLHLAAAEYLQGHAPWAVIDLAYHFDAAGEFQRALPFALAAAEDARRRYSLEIAEQNFRIARRGAESVAPSQRSRIAEGLGEVLMLRGSYEAAAAEFALAQELADNGTARARILGETGELAFKRGDMETACRVIEQGLESLGRRIPRRRRTILAATGWQAFVQALHTLFPGLMLGWRPLRGDPDELLVVRLYSRLAYAYWYAQGPVPTFWAHLWELNLAESYRGETPELAQAYSEHAPAMSMIPFPSRGIAYAKRSRQIREKLHDAWGQGQSLHFLGIVLYAASRYRECIDTCRQAIRMLEKTGDRWEVNIARYQIAASLYRLGDLRGAIEEARRIHLSGLELGDAQSSGISLDIWAMASGGQISEERIREQLVRPSDDRQRTVQVMLAEAIRQLYAGHPDTAVAMMEEAYQIVQQAGLRSTFVSPLLPWLATALRAQWKQQRHVTPGERERLIRRAAWAAGQGLALARWFRNDLPHALREVAVISAIQGKARRARRLFQQSLAVAEAQQARFDYAQTLLLQGQIGRELDWPDAERDCEQAEASLREMRPVSDDAASISQPVPAPLTLSLADRFDNVLKCGRSIASKLSRAEILEEVHRSARSLLRAERCVVCTVESNEGMVETFPVVGDLDEALSQKMVQRAFSLQKPEALVEGAPQDPSDSIVLSGIRSALCAPVLCRGRPAACFYVSHRDVIGLFGDDELRLADFISTIAGAALENAEGFLELQRLNTTLEQRVAERTADAEARARELARSNEELQQFAYVASHDLREPLRTVASYCQLLKRRYGQVLDEAGHEFIEFAVDGSKRMQQLIDDLLAYSRVATQARSFQPVDMDQVLQRVRFNLSVAFQESGTILTSDPLPVVSGDRSQLTQLLQNLVANAIKFRRDQPPEIHVGVRRREAFWEFSVRDNGIGMQPEHFERVFLIFQRLHSRDEYEGTGIGLSICKRTVERHDGTIWVESEPGCGSTFHFTIAIREPALDR